MQKANLLGNADKTIFNPRTNRLTTIDKGGVSNSVQWGRGFQNEATNKLSEVISPKGEAEPEGTISSGARHIPFGGVPEAVSGNAMIVGDASGLANALCYGGIGAAMLSGRKAAEAVMSGRPGTYGRWYSRSIYTNPHFMKAHRQFSDWNDEDISTAMRPFRRGYSVGRGFMAILRHPKFANVYFATWIAFKVGW